MDESKVKKVRVGAAHQAARYNKATEYLRSHCIITHDPSIQYTFRHPVGAQGSEIYAD
jgi:hypothetical protein